MSIPLIFLSEGSARKYRQMSAPSIRRSPGMQAPQHTDVFGLLSAFSSEVNIVVQEVRLQILQMLVNLVWIPFEL